MELVKNREGYLVGETHRECTKCGIIYQITSKMPFCGTCNSERVKTRDLRKKIVARAKSRARERNLEYNLVYTDIEIPTHCPVLGIELYETKGKSGSYHNSPSIDRIDPSKGYIKGNIQIMSSLANVMKNNAKEKELIAFAHWVLNTYSKVPAKE
jgi:hypothetical protein